MDTPSHILSSIELDNIEDLLEDEKPVDSEVIKKMLASIDYWQAQHDDQVRRKRKAHEVTKKMSEELKLLREIQNV